MTVFGTRLKQARLRLGVSQEQLGVLAGIDEASASARMNRYEVGSRMPNPDLAETLAKVLGVPTPYLYAKQDDIAELLLHFGNLSATAKKALLAQLKQGDSK
jgi:transcriptional regulator with XRE-family HTH domain